MLTGAAINQIGKKGGFKTRQPLTNGQLDDKYKNSFQYLRRISRWFKHRGTLM
jgi:hypothetical protein